MNRSTEKLLACVLREPDVVASIRTLAPAVLGSLVRELGIEDAGELLAMATREQFGELVDEDLWTRSKRGHAEVFDHTRFPVWLEVMFEGGSELVAQRLRDLPEDVLAVAFNGQLFVLDVETLGIGMAGASFHEAELTEKALDACLYLEFGNYILVARRPYGWDAVIEAIIALDQLDHYLTMRVLDACCRASTEYMEDNGGLYEVMTAEDVLEEDATAGRDDRRARKGFVSATDARAFLMLAAQTDVGPQATIPERDHISRSYFRELADVQGPLASAMPKPNKLMKVLTDFGVVGSPQKALAPSLVEMEFRDRLGEMNDGVQAEREQELIFLANVLVTSMTGLSPVDAAQFTVETCSVGLKHLVAQGNLPKDVLARVGSDQLFRIGWALREKTLPTLSPGRD